MATILELQEMSDQKLEEMLENNREEMFNLRFQKAATRLKDFARLRQVRRDIAQLETVLHLRWLAAQTAAEEPAIAQALDGKEWKSSSRFDYEESAWRVEFVDTNDRQLASATVNLNQKRPKGRKERAQQKVQPNPVSKHRVY
jgi:large subunit ribosomal protein L29